MKRPDDATGAYEIFEALGRGGMAVVHRAHQKALDREVALKFVRTDHVPSVEMAERFRREALTMGKLSHPNIVRVFDAGLMDGRPFIAMELVRGPTLQALIDEKREGLRSRADDLFAKVLSGVAALHEAGLIHRDIKPSNVMVDGDRAVVMDLGLVKDTTNEATCLTEGGAFVGTLNYMAPEIVASRPYAFACDVWSLGCLYFHMHAGHPPFRAHTVTDLIAEILEGPMPDLAASCPALSPMRLAVLRRLLERDPVRRPRDAVRALSEFQGRARVPSGPSPMRVVSAPSAATSARRRLALAAGLASAVLCALLVEMRPAPAAPSPTPAATAASAPVASPPAHRPADPGAALDPVAVRTQLGLLDAPKLHDQLAKDIEALPLRGSVRAAAAARLASDWGPRVAAALRAHGVPELIERAKRAGVETARDARETVALARAVVQVRALLAQLQDLGVRPAVDLAALEPPAHRCGADPGPARETVALLYGADHGLEPYLQGRVVPVPTSRAKALHLWTSNGGSFWGTDLGEADPLKVQSAWQEPARLPLRAPGADERLVITLRTKSLSVSEQVELAFSPDGRRFGAPIAWFLGEGDNPRFSEFHHRVHPGLIDGPRFLRIAYVHRGALTLKGDCGVRGLAFRYVPR